MCVVLVLFLGISLSSNVYSQEKEKKETKKETMKEMSKDKDSSKTMAGGKAFNTICPVTSEEVDPEITYTYKGKTYALCCNKCLKKIKADPEKYISRLSEDGKSLKKKN
jgi:YHS domain-containing protein